MTTIKLGYAGDNPQENELAEAMLAAGLDFVAVPMSGPMTLWVNGHAHWGYHAILSQVTRLIEKGSV